MLSINSLRMLLRQSAEERQELKKLYAQLPGTRCKRRTICCSLLPEIVFIEALSIIDLIIHLSPDMRKHICRKVISYFFLNPVEIIMCPFLDGDECLIYEERLFGCRAYGLWSVDYYDSLAVRSRQGKKYIRTQWEKLGVSLPKEVVEFQVPYCSHVEKTDTEWISDDQLLHVFVQIEELSAKFFKWHRLFSQMYFYDLSFFISSLFYGTSEAVNLKFSIVNDVINRRTKARLEAVVNTVPDVFTELSS